jgi:hypothetical protein
VLIAEDVAKREVDAGEMENEGGTRVGESGGRGRGGERKGNTTRRGNGNAR